MLAYLFAGCLCLCIGTVFSIPRIWNYFFSPKDTYLKAGEYGETDIKQTWSLWKEPLNAWSSLAYSFYGFVMLYVAVNDYMGTTISISGYNEIQNYSSFSFLFSFSCIYLGIASFLFHASHHEIWRKADAGMTSGVTVLPFVIAIFCRVHIPLISDLTMVTLSFVLQISLTHGYLPYGSSDILVPTFIGTSWFLELSPFYDGIVTSTQITAWLEVFFFVISGMLLRAVDIKRTSKNSFNAIIGIFILQALIFGYFLSINNLSVPIILVTGALVYIFPAKGHVAWHFFSSFALFHWWELLQSRAIQLSLVETDYSRLDFQLLSIVFFVVIKNAGRRLLMTLLPGSGAIRVRLIALFESTLFLLWGVSVMSDSDSTFSQSNSNWLNLIDQESVWTGPVFLSSMFQLYYYVRMAAYAEDAVYTITVPYSSGEDHPKDRLTRAHHIVAGILAISSVFLRQAKFAALVAFLHDVTSFPWELRKIGLFLNWPKIVLQFLAILTVLGWVSWRLYYFTAHLLYSSIFESKSRLFESACEPGACTIAECPERIPLAILLLCVLFFNVIWLLDMINTYFDSGSFTAGRNKQQQQETQALLPS